MKLSKKDLELWNEVTKDVKILDKDSLLKKSESLSVEKENQLNKAKQISEEIFYSTMLNDDKINTQNSQFKTTKAHSSQAEIISQRKSIDYKTLSKLKRGKVRYEGVLDLHGLTLENAKQKLTMFLYSSYSCKKRCVLVIHGKGSNETSKMGRIKQQIPFWIEQFDFVLAFTSAAPKDGGTGALYILLKSK